MTTPAPPPFRSAEPVVRLHKAFTTPFKNVIATARTCYSSKGIVDDAQIDLARHTPLARSIYEAGHHTTYQHAQFQFQIANVSRQFVWSFLHSHPFYNSEQVSQRYVAVAPGSYAVPPIDGDAHALYVDTVERLFAAYRSLIDALTPPVEAEFYRIFPARRKYPDRYARAVRKRAMEAARYVLPVAMFTYLYHTVSGITLLRYHRLCDQYDAPLEQRLVVGRMIDALLAHDDGYRAVLEAPLALDDTPEQRFFASHFGAAAPRANPAFAERFDASLDGRTSRLVDYKAHGEDVLAESVREVLGRVPSELGDDEAIALALDPRRNAVIGEALVLDTHAKIARALYHVHYTFRKKISHSADSQDQRHRMTPASRPVLAAQLGDAPDYIVPRIVAEDAGCLATFEECMDRAWSACARLEALGVPREFALYLLPNASAIRFTESADLLNLRHKHAMRLCYNAQEEIWRASLDEALQIRDVHPRIGAHLLPPCTVRDAAGLRPICPEGDRYCGIKVWRLEPDAYRRLI